MKWRKLGLIFPVKGQHPWMQTHAANPVVLPLEGDLYRVYFACRNAENHSHVGFVEVELRDEPRVVDVSSSPVLAPGPLGFFDSHGVYAGSVVRKDGRLYMYYIGWNPGLPQPMFYSSIGLAVSEDGGKLFQKISPAPILARSQHDPWMVSAPFVMLEERRWRMWYISGFKWERVGETLRSFYHTKYAESHDGVNWDRQGLVALELKPGETNIARMQVAKENGIYHGWYSCESGKGYRVGYAQSADGIRWQRKDEEAGMQLSAEGWDSQAQTYPYVICHKGRHYMFYNGNGFGRDGLGMCIEQE